jgi:predicted glycosyltransferase
MKRGLKTSAPEKRIESLNLWIDLVNAPHVRLFSRLIKKRRGEIDHLLVTYRSYGYLEDLVKMYIDADELILVGRRGFTGEEKLYEFARRVKELAGVVSSRKIDVAASKASPELARTAFGLGIPVVTVNDNENSPTIKLTFPLSSCIVIPEVFPPLECRGDCKEFRFKGVLEIAHVLEEEKEEEENYIAARSEPFGASYMPDHWDSLFFLGLKKLMDETDLSLVYFPREGDRWLDGLRRLYGDRVKVVERAKDLSIVKRASIFVGGGGTMTREAALLGTPTISAYPGDIAVNRLLEERGLIYRAEKPEDFIKFLSEHEERKKLFDKARKLIEECGDPCDVIWSAISSCKGS